jgi:phage shock protein A
MLKQFFALARGQLHETAEAVADRNGLTILRQQIRDCAQVVAAARRAVAVAIAQNGQELEQRNSFVSRIEDLETRAMAALQQDKQALAREAAEHIAFLEAERETCERALQNFGSEIDRLKRTARAAEMRLRELQRGERIVAAADRMQRLRNGVRGSGLSALKDAEATLLRLRTRQEVDAAAAALEELEQTADTGALVETLAEAGCGAPLRLSADDVLARLAARLGGSAPQRTLNLERRPT